MQLSRVAGRICPIGHQKQKKGERKRGDRQRSSITGHIKGAAQSR